MKIHCEYTRLASVESLKPHPDNRNSHPADQIERLAKILKYQGWRYPIKVSTRSGFITSGHGRLLAAKYLGLKEVPVSEQAYDDDAQEYADLVSDNAIASWAELDLAGINTDIGELGPEFDLELLAIKNFHIEPAEKFEMEDELRDDLYKEFIIEVKFPNEMEMRDIHDDLVSRGYIVKVKGE